MSFKKMWPALIVLAAMASAPAFAAPPKPEAPPPPSVHNPFEYEATPAGQVFLDVGPAVGWGFGFDVGADFMIGKFDAPHFPLDWGIAVRGFGEFGFWGGFDWGFSALWTLHKGASFARGANFDFYIGVGPGIGGWGTTYYGAPFGVGFSTYDGVAWEMTQGLWLQIEYGGIYGWNVSSSVFSVGVRIKL